MQRKMVGSCEGSLADSTLEGLGSGVFPVVARQLVRSGKPPFALGPVALVRLLPRVYPLMGLQVRTLRVDFSTTEEVAVVNSPLLELRIVPPVVLRDKRRRRHCR